MTMSKVSRRDFLKLGTLSGSALIIGVGVDGRSGFMPYAIAENDVTFKPNVFLKIEAENTITIVVARTEMGQGARTAMPMLVAEELEVSLDAVKIEQAVGDPKYGDQNTDGSTSVRKGWVPLRQAGAAAREMLIQAAAEAMAVPAGECKARDGYIHHEKSGKKRSYGSLAEAASNLEVPANPALKAKSTFKLIGKTQRALDVPNMVTGKAIYGIDVDMPNMLHASIERCPVVGGRLVSFDKEKAMKVNGVLDVQSIKASGPPANTFDGVVVLAEHTWAAFKGRQALDIKWDLGENQKISSADLAKSMQAALDGEEKKIYRTQGNLAHVADKGTEFSSEYESPFLAHAPMEPPNGTVWLKQDGSCEFWVPSQHPQWARGEAAKALGLDPSKVTVNVTLLGGGFGRKSKPDFTVECALIAKAFNRNQPIKLTWKREDEIRHGFYRPADIQRFTVRLDENSKPLSWQHCSVFPTITSTFNPSSTLPADMEMGQSATTVPFDIPHIEISSAPIKSPLRIGWLRSVHHMFHSWGINSFVDELAAKAKKDPIAYHLELLGKDRILEFSEDDKKSPYKFDTGRLRTVIETVREQSGWSKKLAANEGLGFAAQYSFFSYVAVVAHVQKVSDGQFKAKNFTLVVDCGHAVNPDNVKAQMEGSVVFAMTSCIGQITIDKGQVSETNFHNYPLLRLTQTPQVNVHIVNTDNLPTGVGEPGVPPVFAALTNAVFQASGKRIKKMPFDVSFV